VANRQIVYPQLRDPAYLRDRYLVRGWSVGQIALGLDCSKRTVHLALQRIGITARPPGRPRVAA
jgi:hypothetical protein